MAEKLWSPRADTSDAAAAEFRLFRFVCRLRARGIPAEDVGVFKGGLRDAERVRQLARAIVMCSYGMANEGVDKREADTCILATPKGRVIQAVGPRGTAGPRHAGPCTPAAHGAPRARGVHAPRSNSGQSRYVNGQTRCLSSALLRRARRRGQCCPRPARSRSRARDVTKACTRGAVIILAARVRARVLHNNITTVVTLIVIHVPPSYSLLRGVTLF